MGRRRQKECCPFLRVRTIVDFPQLFLSDSQPASQVRENSVRAEIGMSFKVYGPWTMKSLFKLCLLGLPDPPALPDPPPPSLRLQMEAS